MAWRVGAENLPTLGGNLDIAQFAKARGDERSQLRPRVDRRAWATELPGPYQAIRREQPGVFRGGDRDRFHGAEKPS